MQMTYESMMAFAETWITAWNQRDVEAVLAHFAEEAEFVSPLAGKLAGSSYSETRRSLVTTGVPPLIASRFWNSSSITRRGTRGVAC
jgi:hypothetical protein